MLSFESTVMPKGLPKAAVLALPSINPTEPVPAIVLTIPLAETLRILWLFWSMK
jgi:hypothetical protein